MLRTVQFNNQLCFVAVEINNIIADDILSAELNRILFKKSVPKKPFFLGHFFSQIL